MNTRLGCAAYLRYSAPISLRDRYIAAANIIGKELTFKLQGKFIDFATYLPINKVMESIEAEDPITGQLKIEKHWRLASLQEVERMVVTVRDMPGISKLILPLI